MQLKEFSNKLQNTYLNDNSSDYKTCLIKLKILPLMYIFDINDVTFLIKSIKFLAEAFSISSFVTFISGNTRLANKNKLQHTRNSNIINNNFYFNRISRIWNVLLVINCSLSIPTIKFRLRNFLWNHFEQSFDPNISCTLSFVCPCNRCAKHPKPPNFDKL